MKKSHFKFSIEHIETLVKTLQLFIIVLDKRMRPIYMNEYALRKLAVDNEQITRLNIFDFIDKTFLRDMISEFVGKENILNRETSIILKSGRKIDVDVSVTKLLTASGELMGYVAVVDDVTERRKVEINLSNQIAFSRQIFKAIPDIIIIFNPHLKVVFYNQRAEKVIENTSASDRNLVSYLSEESLEKGFDKTLKNVIENIEYINQINVRNPFSPGLDYVDLIIEPLQSASGIIGGLIIMRDVSEWRSLTERIKNLQFFTQKLIEASPFAVISVNQFDKVTVWNKAAETLFDLNGEHARDQNLYELNPFFLNYRDIIDDVKIRGRSFQLNDQKMDFEKERPAILNLNFYPVESEGRNVVINIEDRSQPREVEDSFLQVQKEESPRKEGFSQPPEKMRIKQGNTTDGAVLLVDDELVIREIGSEMLETLGFKCFVASEGTDALEIFKKKKDEISLIILDIEMPGLSGDRVAQTLREINPNIKILFSSGYTREYLESKVFKDKIEYFIAKPFHLNQLSEKLDRLMRKM